jgi:hypothetical protein
MSQKSHLVTFIKISSLIVRVSMCHLKLNLYNDAIISKTCFSLMTITKWEFMQTVTQKATRTIKPLVKASFVYWKSNP